MGFLAILQAGGVYLPPDPSLLKRRLASMLGDAFVMNPTYLCLDNGTKSAHLERIFPPSISWIWRHKAPLAVIIVTH